MHATCDGHYTCNTAMIVLGFDVPPCLQDGRDRGLDYKISGFHVPPGSWDAQVPAVFKDT